VDIYTITLTAAAVAGCLAAIARWLYLRGGAERELSVAVQENTAVTKELSNSLSTLKEFTVTSFHDLATKVEVLTARIDNLEKHNHES